MASATCPSCGRDLGPGAVLCVACGFDLRTGTRLQTEVTSEGPGRKRFTDQERFAGKRFNACQLRGVSTRILLSNEEGDLVAYLFSRAHPLWTLFTVVVAVPLFFLIPAGLGFLFFIVAERAKIPPPGTGLAIILLTAAFAMGILASLLTVGLLAPRRRLKVWADESRKHLLMRVVETWKFGVARISVIDGDGRLLGRIFEHRRRNRFVLTNHLEQPQAVLLTGKITYSNEWADHSLGFTLLPFLLFGLPGLLVGFLPRRERDYTESFLYRVSSFEEKPAIGIGRVTFNPAREDPYRIEFADEADQSVDRRLVVALMGLMAW